MEGVDGALQDARHEPAVLAVDLEAHLLPGTFEHALHHLLDHDIDLSAFDARFANDETGAPAFPPSMLLKVVLLAYSRGIVSSRGIERACRDHVTFVALSGDSCPHFTTIAALFPGLGDLIADVFKQVLLICDRQGLIGREMFAIDGVKLPSNASKQRKRHARRLLALGAEDGSGGGAHAATVGLHRPSKFSGMDSALLSDTLPPKRLLEQVRDRIRVKHYAPADRVRLRRLDPPVHLVPPQAPSE